jgi:hypothetical protein
MRSIAVFLITFFIGLAGSFADFGTVSTRAQAKRYPNELKGYEFFESGRLKPILLGSSTKEDVQKIFGDTCEKSCDYDDRFAINFEYLSCDSCMTTEYIRDRMMCPLQQSIGAVQKITLTPKVSIHFDAFPTSPFPKNTGGSIMSKGGFGGVSYESFGDEYGLKYSIKKSDTSSLTLSSPGPAYMSGPLYSIEYGLSIDAETKIFKAEFKTCKGRAK